MRASRAIAIVLAVFAAALQRSAAAAEPLQLSFGVYTSDRPTDMYKAFKPILVHLESTLSKSLERPVQIRLRVFNSYDQARTALIDEDLDFARFGPSSYILAKEANPRIHLLAVEEQEGGLTFKGVVFTTEQTGVKRIADLRGKVVCLRRHGLHDRALSGAAIPRRRRHLRERPLQVRLLAEARQGGRGRARGEIRRGAAKEGTVAKFKGKGVKVLETFDNVTKPWVARSKLDAKIIRAIEQCLGRRGTRRFRCDRGEDHRVQHRARQG
jgi:phosphonate transport system substrate-binding protein